MRQQVQGLLDTVLTCAMNLGKKDSTVYLLVRMKFVLNHSFWLSPNVTMRVGHAARSSSVGLGQFWGSPDLIILPDLSRALEEGLFLYEAPFERRGSGGIGWKGDGVAIFLTCGGREGDSYRCWRERRGYLGKLYKYISIYFSVEIFTGNEELPSIRKHTRVY